MELTAERYLLTAPVMAWLREFGQKVLLSPGDIVTIDRKSKLCFAGDALVVRANRKLIKRSGKKLATIRMRSKSA